MDVAPGNGIANARQGELAVRIGHRIARGPGDQAGLIDLTQIRRQRHQFVIEAIPRRQPAFGDDMVDRMGHRLARQGVAQRRGQPVPVAGNPGQFDVGGSGRQLLQDDPGLEPGQGSAEAMVDALADREREREREKGSLLIPCYIF